MDGVLLERPIPTAPLTSVGAQVLVFDYLSELTGKQFKKCGGYTVGLAGWEDTQKRVLDCAVAAAKEPEPFYFLESGLAADSVYFNGWVKTAKGSLLSFNYDSAPCGIRTVRSVSQRSLASLQICTCKVAG